TAATAPSAHRSARKDCSSCPHQFGSVNHAGKVVATRLMGPDPRDRLLPARDLVANQGATGFRASMKAARIMLGDEAGRAYTSCPQRRVMIALRENGVRLRAKGKLFDEKGKTIC
ncbi:hypothetical protein, partial [Paracoccus sp. PARArs4]|uniref:hypothetical protein n=1 Tax=Paracoccus sp. PARArs4 TaxID=2853442 RepID=UPI0024A68A2C